MFSYLTKYEKISTGTVPLLPLKEAEGPSLCFYEEIYMRLSVAILDK